MATVCVHTQNTRNVEKKTSMYMIQIDGNKSSSNKGSDSLLFFTQEN